jgi:predicted component of type VI protein secretion system
MPRLLLKNDAGQFTEAVLKPGSNSFGRAEGNDHQLSDSSISSRHCVVIVSDGAALIRDLGSTNGTFVDSVPIQETELQHGQSVRLGSAEMLYQDQETVTGAARSGAGRIRITVSEPARAAEQGAARARHRRCWRPRWPPVGMSARFIREVPRALSVKIAAIRFARVA